MVRPTGRTREESISIYTNYCNDLGFEFMYHYNKRPRNYVVCKCNECNNINTFIATNLTNNSVKCICKKKKFVKGYIYKLCIGDYWYIGLTDTSLRVRYGGHKKSCFNKRKPGKYNSKIYKTIREYIRHKEGRLPIKKDFDKYVLQKQVAVIYTSRKELKSLETSLIDLNNPWCLNSIK